MDQSQEQFIQFDQVRKRFGDYVAIPELSFQLPQGKIIGLIGPSGSGKTTTVRLISGIHQPSEGQVKVFGKDPVNFTTSDREKIGYMTQLFTLFPDLSVKSNLNFSAAMYGQGIFRRGKRIKQLLKFVELDEHERKLAKNISGGMQRRLQLAASLIHDPSLLLLDEPTAGIDPILRRKFWDHFKELRDEGKSLFITTQYVSEASYCDLVGVLAGGQLLALATPKELRKLAFGGEKLDLFTDQPLSQTTVQAISALPFVKRVRLLDDGSYRVLVEDAGKSLPELLNWLSNEAIEITSLQPYQPPFDDVFVEIVQQHEKSQEEAK